MREIRMLRLMWRGLETESRSGLHGHEGGNPGHGQEPTYWATAPVLDPTGEQSRLALTLPSARDRTNIDAYIRIALVPRLYSAAQ